MQTGALIDRIQRRFLRAGLCYGHGTENARDEAAYLVLGALGIALDAGPERLGDPVTAHARQRVEALAEARIKTRKPVAYLIEQARFAGLSFHVDENVLIPRSPIAELIEAQFAPWVRPAEVRFVLDLCAGSGCIAVACAKAFPEATVDAVDISPEALSVAARNCRRHAVTPRVNLIGSDLFSALGDRQYDLIVSNPPYIRADALSTLPAEYRHEPALALTGGHSGLDVVERILRHAGRYLRRCGVLVMEVGEARVALEEKYPQTPFIWLALERGGEGVFVLFAEELARISHIRQNAAH